MVICLEVLVCRGAPDGDGCAANVGAGAAAEGEAEVDDGHDCREHQGSRRNHADDPKVIGDVLRRVLIQSRADPILFTTMTFMGCKVCKQRNAQRVYRCDT